MRKIASLVAAGLISALLGALPAAAQSERTVLELELDGVVDPFIADHIAGGIESADPAEHAAVLVRIDTPGGLDSSMREIIKAILDSDVPVVCFVAPEGARAASAGAFILTACHVAAMAPATNVGAAHPVGVSGAILRKKVVNDAAAYIRSLADLRGRNADWAESAVRDAASVTAAEALDLGAIDLVTTSASSLLTDIDGTSVSLANGTVTLETAGTEVTSRGMNPGAALLHRLLDPNLAFIFFFLGLALLATEAFSPGLAVPGVAGAVSLVLAIASFGMLPITALGVLLLVAAAAFFVIEVAVPGLGVAGLAGVVCLVIGGSVLYGPGASVSAPVLIVTAAVVFAFFALAIPVVLRERRKPSTVGPDRLVGKEGVVVVPLAPSGRVKVEGVDWSAVGPGETIHAGERVKVSAVDGMKLQVVPAVTEETAPI